MLSTRVWSTVSSSFVTPVLVTAPLLPVPTEAFPAEAAVAEAAAALRTSSLLREVSKAASLSFSSLSRWTSCGTRSPAAMRAARQHATTLPFWAGVSAASLTCNWLRTVRMSASSMLARLRGGSLMATPSAAAYAVAKGPSTMAHANTSDIVFIARACSRVGSAPGMVRK